MSKRFVRSFLWLGFLAVAICIGASVSPHGEKAAYANPGVNQQPIRWNGVCNRCSRTLTRPQATRPVLSECNRCGGKIIWQPIYE